MESQPFGMDMTEGTATEPQEPTASHAPICDSSDFVGNVVTMGVPDTAKFTDGVEGATGDLLHENNETGAPAVGMADASPTVGTLVMNVSSAIGDTPSDSARDQGSIPANDNTLTQDVDMLEGSKSEAVEGAGEPMSGVDVKEEKDVEENQEQKVEDEMAINNEVASEPAPEPPEKSDERTDAQEKSEDTPPDPSSAEHRTPPVESIVDNLVSINDAPESPSSQTAVADATSRIELENNAAAIAAVCALSGSESATGPSSPEPEVKRRGRPRKKKRTYTPRSDPSGKRKRRGRPRRKSEDEDKEKEEIVKKRTSPRSSNREVRMLQKDLIRNQDDEEVKFLQSKLVFLSKAHSQLLLTLESQRKAQEATETKWCEQFQSFMSQNSTLLGGVGKLRRWIVDNGKVDATDSSLATPTLEKDVTTETPASDNATTTSPNPVKEEGGDKAQVGGTTGDATTKDVSLEDVPSPQLVVTTTETAMETENTAMPVSSNEVTEDAQSQPTVSVSSNEVATKTQPHPIVPTPTEDVQSKSPNDNAKSGAEMENIDEVTPGMQQQPAAPTLSKESVPAASTGEPLAAPPSEDTPVVPSNSTEDPSVEPSIPAPEATQPPQPPDEQAPAPSEEHDEPAKQPAEEPAQPPQPTQPAEEPSEPTVPAKDPSYKEESQEPTQTEEELPIEEQKILSDTQQSPTTNSIAVSTGTQPVNAVAPSPNDIHVRVGVGVLVRDPLYPNKIFAGIRKGSHGAGKLALPGGHLELFETWEDCAKREVLEEMGLTIDKVKFAHVTNDIMASEGKHYVTIFMLGECMSEDAKPKTMEVDKCAGWNSYSWSDLEGLLEGEKGGKTSSDSPALFGPLRQLVVESPESVSTFMKAESAVLKAESS